MYIFLKATTFLLILHFSSSGFCVSLRFPANNWPSAVWLWFRQHGKHWECMKSYDVQIVLKTITALSEPCGAAQCHAAVAWLKRTSNCGHTQFWYDSREVLKVQHCLSSNAYIMKWERSDREGALSSNLQHAANSGQVSPLLFCSCCCNRGFNLSILLRFERRVMRPNKEKNGCTAKYLKRTYQNVIIKIISNYICHRAFFFLPAIPPLIETQMVVHATGRQLITILCNEANGRHCTVNSTLLHQT